jgi:transposase
MPAEFGHWDRVSLALSSGARHDASVFETVLDQCPVMSQLAYDMMDKGYDSEQMRQHLQAQEVMPVIPPRQNRKEPLVYDTAPSKRRERVERFFNKLKRFRRLATRYEKLSQTFLAFVYLVASWLMIR